MLFDEWTQRHRPQKFCMHMQALTTCFFITAILLAKLLYELPILLSVYDMALAFSQQAKIISIALNRWRALATINC